MTNQRPNPDELLARVQADEAQQARGKLKIFFGAAAGVGKTFTMLDAAHARKAEGVAVVVGYVETHGRAETDALLEGLEQLPPLLVNYRGTTLREFDLDAALRRCPTLILVDELAHTNAPGLRHAKRWQDIEELLQAGINVYTTVNVQHLESLNDVVAQITNVIVRETVPDSILERADEVELIDLPPDELLQRLHEGKVYVPEHAKHAVNNFFRKGNLIALRELALRRTADRVDAQMQSYKQDHAIPTIWPTQERLLVGISTSPHAARLVRATRRIATRLHAEWIVVYVETPQHARLTELERNRVLQTLRLAEKLGAETVTLNGPAASEELLRYAHKRNVNKIVIGKPNRPLWRDLLFGSMLESLVRASGEIDVYVISGEQEDASLPLRPPFVRTSPWSAYAKTLLIVGCCTILANLIFRSLELSNLIMLYLLGVTFVAFHYGRGPSILAALLSVAAFDFFYVQPYFTFAVSDAQYILTFVTMLIVALVISTLAVRIRTQAEAARQRERRTAALYALTRELASKRGLDTLVNVATNHIRDVFESQTAILLPNPQGLLETSQDTFFAGADQEREVATAQWVYDHKQMAGQNTDTLPSVRATYVPLVATRGPVGVLAIKPADPQRLLDPEQVHWLETLANQISVAIERAQLAKEAEVATVQIETERLRNTLLSSISHDLRTPLASITGAASSLLDSNGALPPATHHELLTTIVEESERLNYLLSNLLDMTRLEAGTVQVHKEWQPLEEVIGSALTRLARQLQDRQVTTQLPPDLPLAPLDGVLIEQVLTNLLENVIKYTAAGSPLEIQVHATKGEVFVSVADHGPGLPEQQQERIFAKFYRLHPDDLQHGAGLGLTISRGIVEAHGGRIWAANRADGSGAIFTFTLPLDGKPPLLEQELAN
ncbi:MAG: sensor histidine kinase KdpD [Caldilineaceae bacterium]